MKIHGFSLEGCKTHVAYIVVVVVVVGSGLPLRYGVVHAGGVWCLVSLLNTSVATAAAVAACQSGGTDVLRVGLVG